MARSWENASPGASPARFNPVNECEYDMSFTGTIHMSVRPGKTNTVHLQFSHLEG